MGFNNTQIGTLLAQLARHPHVYPQNRRGFQIAVVVSETGPHIPTERLFNDERTTRQSRSWRREAP